MVAVRVKTASNKSLFEQLLNFKRYNLVRCAAE